MHDDIKHDILIIGGGPAGLSTALHLQKIAPWLAERVLVLEREHYPRRKLCAGGLVLDAEHILEALGLDVSEIPHVDVDKIHFDIDQSGIAFGLPGKRAMRVIRREEFDAWLAKKAESRGIEIRDGIAVKSIDVASDGLRVITDHGDFLAEVVVGADGSNGITRRAILPNESVATARLLEVITPLPPHATSAHDRSQHQTGAAYFEFAPVPNNIAGYVWDFPTIVNGQAMRCWGVYDTNLLASQARPALKTPLADEMKRSGFDLDDYRIEGHPIRWYQPGNTASVPRVLLVGDAAGADPVFGEGISFALGYGLLAAREIKRAFKRRDFSFRGYGRRLAWSGLGQALLARWFLAYLIYSFNWKWFQILVWRVFKPVTLVTAWLFVLNWSKRLE